MNLSDSTRIAYSAGIPGVTGTVTLFNSVTAFPPGGSFHLLGQQWFQYSLRTASDGGTATGTVVGSYSNDKGVTWLPFYSKSTTDADDDNAAAVADVFTDEVYIGSFKDIRFQYTNATEQLTIFDPLLSLHCRKPTSKVDDGSLLIPFDPAGISLGAVSSWLRNTTITGSIASVPDLLNPLSPATQSTAARKPTGNADGSMSFDGNDCLVVPFHASNNSTTATGCCFWVKHTSLAAIRTMFSQTAAAGASASRGRFECGTTGTATRTGGAVGGQADHAAGTFVTTNPHFISVEFDGTASLGSRHSLFIDNVLIAVTGDTLPAALASSTGTWTIGAVDTSGTLGVVGSYGRNFYVINSKMSGATQGLLTSAARAALMAFEPLT